MIILIISCIQIRTREAVHLLSTETYQQMQSWLDSLRSVAFAPENNVSTSTASEPLTSTVTTDSIKKSLTSKSIPGAIKLTVNGPSKERTLTNGQQALNDFISSSIVISSTDHQVGHQPQQEENMLYSSVDSPDLFSVKLIESESTNRCKLLPIDYYLLLTSVSISLAEQLSDTRQGKILWTWPYRHIRRYGCTKEGFTLEAGRKCLTGEGLFSFVTTDGSTIFKCVASHVTSLKTTSPNGVFPVPRTSPNIIQSKSCSNSTPTVSSPSPDNMTIDSGPKVITTVPMSPSSNNSTITTTSSTGHTNGSIICTARPVIINNEGLTGANKLQQSTNHPKYQFNQRSSSPKPPSLPKVPRPNQRESPISSNNSKQLDKLTNMVTVTTTSSPSTIRQTESGLITISNNNININGYPSAVKPPRRGRESNDQQLTQNNHEDNSIETIAIPVTIVDPLYEDPIFVSREELFGLKVEDDNHYEIPVIVNNNQPSNQNNQGAINGDSNNQVTINSINKTNGLGENNRKHNMKPQQQQQQLTTSTLTLADGGKTSPSEMTSITLTNDKLPRIHPHSMSRLTSVIRSMFTGNLGNIVNPRSKQSVKLEKYNSQSSSSEGSYCSLSSGSGGGGGHSLGGVGSISLEKMKQDLSSCSSASSDSNESPYSEICDISIETPSNHHHQSSSDDNVIMMMMVEPSKSFQSDEGNYVNLIPQVNHHNQEPTTKSTSSTTTIVTNVNPDHYIQNDAEYALIMKRSVSCGKL